MKKTRKSDIPDFSPKPKGVQPAGANTRKGPKPPPAKGQVVKPQSATGKSGHRGG